MDPRRFRHVFQNEAGAGGAAAGGDAGGGGAAAGAAAAGAAGGAGAADAGGAGAAGAGGGNGAAAGAGGAAGSALAAGAAAAAAAGGTGGAAGGTPDPLAWLPEKYRVTKEDGAIDYEASSKKVAEGYSNLEKRLGSGDAPPQTADGYKINVPEAMKDKVNAETLGKDEGFKADIAKLHAVGASQKVVDSYVATVLERGAAMREALPQLQAADCVAELKQQDGWKSDQEYTAQVGLAFNAAKQIFGKDFDAMESRYGNDPAFIRGMANIGREMQEDRGPSPEAQQQVQTSLDALMSSPAYLNAGDPKHHDTVAKVTALTAQLAGTKPVGSGKTMSFKT